MKATPYRLGKWSEAGVPHKGWVCVEEIDLFEEAREENPGEWIDTDEIAMSCEMCEHVDVTRVYRVEHDNHEELIVCSGCCRAMTRPRA